jgi:hypothetical protein
MNLSVHDLQSILVIMQRAPLQHSAEAEAVFQIYARIEADIKTLTTPASTESGAEHSA